MTQSIASLNAEFGIADTVSFRPGAGGLKSLRVQSPCSEAVIYLHGAHLAHYQPAGHQPVLFISSKSAFAAGKPIRGGVPICYPWFAARADDPAAPMHGFVRTAEWRVEAVEYDEPGIVRVAMVFDAGDEIELRQSFQIGPDLQMRLEVRNRSAQRYAYEAALHSYFYIDDVRKVSIDGLQNTKYISKSENFALRQHANQPITFAGEIDRVYNGTQATCFLNDPLLGRRIVVAKEKANSTVIWNPWSARARSMADLGDDDYLHMVCIETCNVGSDRVELEPNGRHVMAAIVSVEGV